MIEAQGVARNAVPAGAYRPRGQARLLATLLVAATPSVASAQQTHATLTLYKTASSAACGGDQTVWVDPKTQTYYLTGKGLYAKTTPGGYNCRQQAEAAGYRASGSR